MQRDTRERFADALAGAEVTHELLCALQRAPRTRLDRCVAQSLKPA
jgi:hypothetical protein